MSDAYDWADDCRKSYDVATAELRARLERAKVTIGDCTLYSADCAFVLPTLRGIGAVVTDPPYGMKWDTNSNRYTGGNTGHRTPTSGRGRGDWGTVTNDDTPFDPAPWLKFKHVILWGANHYAARLPKGSTLVWLKRNDAAFGSFLSDAEIAWKKGGHGVYCRRDLSMNAITKQRAHPNQKPVSVMRWCVEKTKGTVLDPFMGSGSTGVACVELGRPFVGIEIEPRFFEAACRRIQEAHERKD